MQLQDVELLRTLEKHGLFEMDASRNRLYLPVDGKLADEIESSPHRGRTRSSYNIALGDVLDDLAKTSDGKAALVGDIEALNRIADRVHRIQDTLKVAMVTGNVFPTTPDRLSKQSADAMNRATIADLDQFASQHPDEMQSIRRMGSVESEWAAITRNEPSLRAVVDAAQVKDRHLVAGPQELPEREVAGRMELRMAVDHAQQSNRLVLSEASSRVVTQVLVDDLPSIGGAKDGIYDLAANPPASYKPMSQRGGVLPELLFGNPTSSQALRHAGLLASAVDTATTVQQATRFYDRDNPLAAQSELAHFAGRNIGGWAGGTSAAYLLGTTSGAGPMALIAADALLFSMAGEKAADWMDDRSIYVQTLKTLGHTHTWEFTGRAWTRPGMADVTQDGVDNPVPTPIAASYEKARELNCAATNASVGLALKALPPAQNPFELPAGASDRGSVSEAPWIRDPEQGQWHRMVKTGVSGENNRGTYVSETASPQRQEELDAQAKEVIERNVANSPAAVAARYDLVYHRAGWGEHQLPRSAAADKVAGDPDRLSTWDGNEYQRSADGQWLRHGVPASGNALQELEGTRTVLQESLREHNALVDAVRANPPTAHDIEREQMQYMYRMAGSELRQDWQEAITLATERTRSAVGLTGGATQLQPDWSKNFTVASPIAHLEIGDDGVRRVVAVTTSEEILLAVREVHTRAQVQSTIELVQEMRGPVLPDLAAEVPHGENPRTNAITPMPFEEGPVVPDRGSVANLESVKALAPESAGPAQPEAPPARPTPLDPQHPDHRLYEQIRERVGELDAARGRSFDETSERLTGSLLVLAKGSGLERVDHVVLSTQTADLRAGQNVFVVQGELNDPAHRRAHMATADAINIPLDESLHQFDRVRQEQQERSQQQGLQQQNEEQQRQGSVRGM